MFCCILGYLLHLWLPENTQLNRNGPESKERETEDNQSKSERGIKQISKPPPISTFSQVAHKRVNWNAVPLRLTSKITHLHNR